MVHGGRDHSVREWYLPERRSLVIFEFSSNSNMEVAIVYLLEKEEIYDS